MIFCLSLLAIITDSHLTMRHANFGVARSLDCYVGSSCQDTMARCEAADECRWHLGELRVRCAPNTCRRAECAAGMYYGTHK
ncbi:hypothetical protein NECAME_07592 [Necator americanus]|uniref:EB module n=1 Tax=Necator americanus TaxID=51031 RepID=W2TLM0_NECAM|nr:hypothetical protein NECAME_07592 [Necator americanus]ETN83000.1 hypothetical protein NECAME_07592 [Necator americanus]